jgi:2-polyprenyl-3-methyl-5-hydroxy-6-metoxy-1,4-benzoquinol methylase
LAEYGYTFNERPRMLECIPYGSSVLEVGCGRGGFGLGLRRDRGVTRSVGIEVNVAAADEARAYFDNVLCAPYPDVLDRIDEKFDCVVFNDVLEHLIDPWEALRRTRGILEPTGIVVASIPNVRVVDVSIGLLRGDWTYQDEGVLDRTHLRFFTRTSIMRMMDEAGYEVESICPINPLPRFHRLARHIDPDGRYGRTIADLVHLQFAVTARPG